MNLYGKKGLQGCRLIGWCMVIGILAGCASAPPPPRGGHATQSAPPGIAQQMRQPDAPEGLSRQSFTERITEHRADGMMVVTERTAETALGGSQDWAEIVRQYGHVDILKRVSIALVLLIGGVVAIAKGWPVMGFALVAGGMASAFLVWWAGLVGVVAALCLYFGWNMALGSIGTRDLTPRRY